MILQIGKSGVNPYASFDYSLYVTAGEWFHITYVYNGNGVTEADKVQIYINGAPLPLTFTLTMHSSTSGGANTTVIGKDIILSNDWNGGIDEVSIFDFSLTQQNVTDIYNNGTPTDLSLLATPPTNYWKMGENATFVYGANPDGTWTIPDEVGTNNGTSNNLMSDSARVGESPGSANNALSFNMDLIDRVEDTP